MGTRAQFMKLVDAMLKVDKWTPRHFKVTMESNVDWKMKLPGLRSMPQAIEVQDQIKVMNALHEDELDGRVPVEGIRLMRVARESDKTMGYVKNTLARNEQMGSLHAYLRHLDAKGVTMPSSMEEASELMKSDPVARNLLSSTATIKHMRRKMLRRAGRHK